MEKRQHALFGERLALDIDNAFSVVAESLISGFREQEDYEGFKMACIVNFGLETKIEEEEFKKGDLNTMIDKLYGEATNNYTSHKEAIKKQAIPVFKNIRLTQGNHIENVVVPFSDGRKGLNVLASLDKTLSTQGEELASSLEKSITLVVIDEAWKEHLRAMDDLKQSVQTAYLEQKDPLVIYKVEAFQQFKNMDAEVNKDIVSFLSHGQIPIQSGPDGSGASSGSQLPGGPKQPILREGKQEKTRPEQVTRKQRSC
jgi:preprotein translocase subunit SecA